MNVSESRASWKVLLLYPLSMLILSPILYEILITLDSGLLIVEGFQIFLLLLGAIVSGFLAYQQKDKRIFWLWAMMWWIVLFGRSINWGRLIWPDYSRDMFHVIAGILIATLLMPLFVPKTRRAIVKVVRIHVLPFKIVFVLAGIFIAVDQVEHMRFPFSYFQTYLNVQDIDLLEEIVETFFIVGLFEFIRYYK